MAGAQLGFSKPVFHTPLHTATHRDTQPFSPLSALMVLPAVSMLLQRQLSEGCSACSSILFPPRCRPVSSQRDNLSQIRPAFCTSISSVIYIHYSICIPVWLCLDPDGFILEIKIHRLVLIYYPLFKLYHHLSPQPVLYVL